MHIAIAFVALWMIAAASQASAQPYPGVGTGPKLGELEIKAYQKIPKDKRDTRAVIQAVADAYLDNWGDPTIKVPHGTPCARLEGRLYTGTRNPEGNTCNMPAFPQKLKVGQRRYVIDETIGAVDIFSDFPWIDAGLPPDQPGTPTSNQFRVESGKTRYIHEVTVCTTPKCGRGRPPGGAGSAPTGK